MANLFQTAWSEIIANIQKSRKSQAIRLYARRLGRLLQARYGKQDSYTPLQVKTAIDEAGFNTNYEGYGLAIYCNDLDFNSYHHSLGESCDYQAMQSEIGQCLFGNNVEFNMTMVLDPDFQSAANGHHHDSGTSAPAEQVQQHHDGGHTSVGHHDAGSYTGGDFGGGDFGGGNY
ncbi:DUF6559 family protein [Chamaesiphon sp. VAR_69_metabat_338]|uniref:DUF6559 family protein n=1 Tax=Chamaesiphon sp. VAR_69_metabat_338 TaxID=2964704 RepID=UPI00286E2F70|nr:DUF6559 family protein [Chamaesiphon sp. VAR_69_metabat_338]